MSRVRVLVGTRKGAFILTSDGKRENGKSAVRISRAGRFIISRDRRLIRIGSMRRRPAAGLARSFSAPTTAARRGTPEHLANRPPGGMPRARATSSSTTLCGNRQAADHAPVVRRHATSLGVQAGLASGAVADRSRHRLRRRRRRRILPLDRRRPDLARAPGLRGHGTGPNWQPGAGGMGLHTIILDPSNPERIYIAISAAGAFRTDDGGKTWKPINRGLNSQYIPDPNAEVGHCVHHIAMHPSRRTCSSCRSTGTSCAPTTPAKWHEVSGNLPTDFGFPIDVHAHEPETIYVVPIKSDSEHYPPDGKLRVYRSRRAETSGSR